MRKYIRMEKSRIRKEVSDLEKQEELIRQVYQKFGVERYKVKKETK